jgi:hypothetical protein
MTVKGKANCAGLDRPIGFQECEAPRFHDNRHMKVVRLSALIHRPPLSRILHEDPSVFHVVDRDLYSATIECIVAVP